MGRRVGGRARRRWGDGGEFTREAGGRRRGRYGRLQQPCKVQRGGIGVPLLSSTALSLSFSLFHSLPPIRSSNHPSPRVSSCVPSVSSRSHFLHRELCSGLSFLAPPRHFSSSEVTIPHLPPLTPPADSFAAPSARTPTHTHTYTRTAGVREGNPHLHEHTNESACHTQSIICKDPPPGCHGNSRAGARGARQREERDERTVKRRQRRKRRRGSEGTEGGSRHSWKFV